MATLVHEAVCLKLQTTASIRGEMPIHFFGGSKQVPPKPHPAGADGPIVLEPSGIACRSSVDIQESTQDPDAALVR